VTEWRSKLHVLSVSWNNSVHMYTCTFIHLYCKMNFKRQLNTRYLINTIFFYWNIAAGAWLSCLLDCFSRCLFPSSLHGCMFINYVSLQRERKTTCGHNTERLRWDTVYGEAATIYLWETDRSDCKARQIGLVETQNFCFKILTYFLPVCTTHVLG